jgi:probable F420-dependent oxidoreductase
VRVGTSLPLTCLDTPEQFVTADAIAEIATAAEQAGFDSIAVSDHPFPDDDWLRHGNGHHNHDPFVALSFAAAATTAIRLRTALLVLPYRNPFLAARSVASLDVLSGGRVVLGVGAGYLEAEFRALGVSFEERNELADEAIIAMRRAWTEDGVRMTGRHFDAGGHTMLPRPDRAGGPPIWAGGNSRRAIRRAVELCDGWSPMPYAGNAVSRRTATLASLDDLRARLAYVDEHAEAVGRTAPLGVSFGLDWIPLPTSTDGTDALVEAGELLAELGVTDTTIVPPANSRAEYVAELQRLGGNLLPRLHAIPERGRTGAQAPN